MDGPAIRRATTRISSPGRYPRSAQSLRLPVQPTTTPTRRAADQSLDESIPHAHALGGGTGISSPRDSHTASAGHAATTKFGAGDSAITTPPSTAGGKPAAIDCFSPLQDNAEIDGPKPRPFATRPSTHPASPQCASHTRFPRHATAARAALHCAALNRTDDGGVTPFRTAQTSRSCSVWQQQCVQHSVAEIHTHPHPSHGYRSPLTQPIHSEMNRGEGIIPSEDSKYAHSVSAEIALQNGVFASNEITYPQTMLPDSNFSSRTESRVRK